VRRHNGVLAAVALACASTTGVWAQAPPAPTQLPTGGQVVQGAASISQSSTAQAASMVVNQSSARAVVDWGSFNVGANAQVRFNQPNAQSATLNRVNDANPSQIFGRIESNGQVILSNANGVYFSPSSRLDMGALTATTHSIDAQAFMAGSNTFGRNGATGRVVNEGQIQTALGGYVALLAPEVQNSGVIVARAGTVALASGEQITLNLNSQGGLAGITTTASTLQTLIENRHAIAAPDGLIILSGVALNKLQAGLVKNSGTLEANSLTHKGGKVVLEGDEITLTGTSAIEAKGPTGGGTVLVGGDWQGSGDLRQATKVTMAAGARIDASATEQGDGGKVVLWSDIHNAGSVTQMDGLIEAKAAGAGNGGQVETSGHDLKIGSLAKVSTAGGQWLLDPYDFIVASSGGNITGQSLSTLLASNNITITASTTANTSDTSTTKYGSGSSSALGDIYINDKVSWGAGTTLTLSAASTTTSNVYVNAPMNLWGNSKLTVTLGTSGNLLMGLNKAPESSGGGFYGRIDFTTTEGGTTPRTGTGILSIGGNGYVLIGSVGLATDNTSAPAVKTLQSVSFSNAAYAALAMDIDASATASWNSGNGFTPLTNTAFNGLGHVIKGLTIRNSGVNVGFFSAAPSKLLNVGLDANSSITSTSTTVTTNYYSKGSATGALAGFMSDPTYVMKNVYSNASVTALTGAVGGLVGYLTANLSNSSSHGNVTVNVDSTDTTGRVSAGGFAGTVRGNILTVSDSVATGNVSIVHGGTSGATQSLYAGGFAGQADVGASSIVTFSNDMASGNVSIAGAGTRTANRTDPYGAVAGGFLGWGFSGGQVNGYSVVITKSVASGNVSVNIGAAGGFAGSIAGYGYGANNSITKINESFSTGNVSATTSDASNALGGFIGGKYTTSGGIEVKNNYATGNVTNPAGGLGKTGEFFGSNDYSFSDSHTVNHNYGSGSITNPGTAFTASWWTLASNYNFTGTTALTNLTALNNAGTYWGQDSALNNNYPFLVNNTPAGFKPTFTLKTSGTWGGYTATAANPVLYGSGLSGKTVNVYNGSTLLGTAAVASGNWAYQAASDIVNGWYFFSASQAIAGPPTYTSKSSLVATYNALPLMYVLVNAGQSMIYGSTPSITYALFTDAAGTTPSGASPSGTATFSGVSSTSNVGTYSITYDSGLTSSSYNFAAGTARDFKVNKATVSLSASKTYDGTDGLSGSQLTVTGVNGQTLNYSAAMLSTKNVSGNASNFVTTLTLADKTVGANTYLASNYQLPNMSVRSASNTASISAATVTLAAAKTYDGLVSLLSDQLAVNGVNGETLNYAGTPVINSKDWVDNASNFVSGLTGISDKTVGAATYLASNYLLPSQTVSSVNNSVAIGKANLTQIAASKTYDGLATVSAAQMGTIAGVNSESFTATAGTASISDKYVATANKSLTDLSGLTLLGSSGAVLASNYNLSSHLPAAGSNNAVTISRANLSLAAVSDTKTYNGNTTSTATVNVTGKASTDTVTVSQAFTNKNALGANASTLQVADGYRIEDGSSVDMSANYTITTSTAAGTINKANLTQVTASKVYDGLSTVTHSQIGSIVGVNGESFTATSGLAAISDANVATANKTLTDLSNLTLSGNNGGLTSNYNLASGLPSAGANNQVTITTAPLTMTALNASKVLGANDPTFEARYSGFVNGETDAVLSGISVSRAGSGTSAMTYTGELVPTATSTNYAITPVNGNFTIVPRETLLVTLGNASKAYGASVSGLIATSAKYVDLAYTPHTVALTSLGGGQYSFTDGLGTTGSFTVTTNASANSGVGNYDITLTNFVKSGTNFEFLASQAGNLAVNPLAVAYGSATVSKVYNGNTAAQATVNVSNKVGADDVTVLALGSYTDNKNVGTSHTYSVVAQQLSGSAAGNYYLSSTPTLTGANGVITAAPMTISGITASNKVYNGDTTATVSASNAVFTGLVAGDQVTVSGATGTFANKQVDTNKVVTLSTTFGGADRNNYSITPQASTTANITPAALTISGVTANNKVYDGTTAASMVTSAASITGILGSDTVSVSATGAFADKSVGTGKTITISAYTLSSTDGGNYTMSGQTSATADISAKPLTISGITAQNKTFDSNTSATLNFTNMLKTGMVSGDSVTVSGTGTFADADVGSGKLVSLALSHAGADVGNYTITDQTSTTADILAAATNRPQAPSVSVIQALPSTRGPRTETTASADSAAPSSAAPSNAAASNASASQAEQGAQGAQGAQAGGEGVALVGDVKGMGSSGGLEVKLVSAPAEQSQGLITVVLPKGALDAGTTLVIPVADQIGQYVAGISEADISVSLPNNMPLPIWIEYRAADNAFVLSKVPTGALPMLVAMTFKDVRFLVRISESAVVN
jgi:filamentous hemagglutinin family protein